MFQSQGEGGAHEGISLTELRELVARHARLVALGCLAGALLAVAVVGLRQPVYRATATLLLDQNRSAGGLLGDLAAITAAPVATSEVEILSSRTVAEAVVARPAPGAPDEDAEATALGLTTLVEDQSLRPLAALQRRLLGGRADGAARLEATVEPTAPRDEELELLVEFLAPDRVRVAERTPLARAGFGGAEPQELEYRPGAALEYRGLRLRLSASGPVEGRTFAVRWLPFEDAVERVMKSTRVAETQRNSGVIELVYEDSDPLRAAATANALCRNYLQRNLRRSEKRASQTVDFIQEQLDEQIEKLSAAEKEVVELQSERPQAVDVGETAKSWIQELSSIELERVQLRLARTSLAEAVELIEQGRFDALSRVGPELADPISQSYVERIAQLTSEADLLERRDAGAYKALVQSKLLELQAARDALELRLKTLRKIAADLEQGRGEALGGLASTAESGASDPLLSAYVERWTAVDARLRELEQEFTDALPEIGELRGERAQAEARILELVRGRIEGYAEQAEEYGRLVEGYERRLAGYPAAERETIERALAGLRERTLTHLRSRLAGLRGREDKLAEELGAVEGRLARLPEEERELADPMRRLESHSEIVKFLLGRQKEAEITRAATVPSAEFIDTAVPPRVRRAPSIPMHVALGVVLGACLALGLAFVREALDKSIFTAAELEQAAGLPVFGTVPDFTRGRTRVRGAGDRFVALRDDPEGPVAEAYRSLRANLKFALSGEDEIRTIACTSCTEGEGKSVTNVGIALAFASADKRVLLVDADMRRPSVHRKLDIELAPGLSDVLEGRRAWRDCVRPGVHPGLDLIPAGTQPMSPGDLLSSRASQELLAELRDEYDLVVLDVPPALAVADIHAFSASLDAMLLVCKSSKLSHGVVEHAARHLRRGGANLIGAVLNAARPTRGEAKYGYGYGYGYGRREAA